MKQPFGKIGFGLAGCTAASLMAVSLVTAMPAQAAETTTYSYDAKGRLLKVARVRSGTSTGTTTTDYTHDKADNRKKVKTTKS